MKKDISKITKKLIMLCWFTILSCLVLKLFGYNKFEIPIFKNDINIWIKRIVNFTLFIINGICFYLILIKRKPKKLEISTLILLSFCDYLITYIFNINATLCILIDYIVYLFCAIIYNKELKIYQNAIECALITLIFIIYQTITLLYKNINIGISTQNIGFIEDKILQIDYYILIVLTIIHNFKEGGTIYGRWWKKFLVFLSKHKSNKQSLSKDNTPIQQTKEKNDVGFKLFIVMLSIAQISIVGTTCYFVNNVILEYFVIIISFFIMRQCFGKSYHANSVIKCTTLSILVFTIATKVSMPMHITILCNVLIGCLVAYIMHIWYYYIKYTSNSGITICKGMKLDDLIEIKNQYSLTEIEFNVLNDYYINKMKINDIAFTYEYSSDNIKKIKAKALNKITKRQIE